MNDNKGSQPNSSPWLRVNSAPAEAVKAVLDQGTVGYLASAQPAAQEEPKASQNVIIHDGKLQPNSHTQHLGATQPQQRHDSTPEAPSVEPQAENKELLESELETLNYAQSWQQSTQPRSSTQTNAATDTTGATDTAKSTTTDAASGGAKAQLSDDEIIANVYRSFEDWGQQHDNVKRNTPKRDTVTRHAASRHKDQANRDATKLTAQFGSQTSGTQGSSTVPGAPRLAVPPIAPPPDNPVSTSVDSDDPVSDNPISPTPAADTGDISTPTAPAGHGVEPRDESRSDLPAVRSEVPPRAASAEHGLLAPQTIDESNLINPVKTPPKKGWRRMVHTMSGGRVNPGGSASEQEEERLLEAVRAPLRGDYRIAVMSLKGGVGKTTTTVALGGVFAAERGDRVIAIDANPDLGTLAQRAAAPGPATIRDLLNAEDTTRYPEVRAFTNQASSRLEVIGSERDPAVSEAFSEQDYRRAIDILQHHYNVILTDCGTGLMHSAMAGVLDLANTLVLVTSPALDGAQAASATLDWLSLHGYEQLAANSVVVISAAAPGKPMVDMEPIEEHFRARTRAVHQIPYDRHLAEGAVVEMECLARPTLTAYRRLAASVAEDFSSWHRHALDMS